MEEEKRNRIIAAAAALLFLIVVLLILLFSYMHSEWPPKDRPEPERTDIFFGGEYVMLGDTPEPAASDLAASQPAAVDPADAPKADNSTDPERLTTTDLESPAKKQKSQADGADEAARRAEQKKKKEEERRRAEQDRINSSVKNSFGSGSGKQGSPNGNATHGAVKGSPGFDLAGRSMESWGSPSSTVEGTIVIKVRVNPKGQVVDASYKSGTGAAAADKRVRESCRKASLRSRFSVAENRTTDQVGTITWRFE